MQLIELQYSKLIHALQRERGATCASVAGSSDYFAALVVEEREATDKLITDSCLSERLQALREDVDGAVVADPVPHSDVDVNARTAITFYSIFQRFNALIQEALKQQRHGKRDDEIYDAFIRLKEATGVERAFLCGALALPVDSLVHLPSRAFADLVIGMQQQRQHEATIREKAPSNLLELVSAGFEHSPELREIQSRLLQDFDVVRLRQSVSADTC